MPYINKTPKKKRSYQKHNKQAELFKLYNSRRWKTFRNVYFMKYPCCQACEALGKTSPTEEIHHLKPISTGNSTSECRELAYDYDNLCALCIPCHHKIHEYLNTHKDIPFKIDDFIKWLKSRAVDENDVNA